MRVIGLVLMLGLGGCQSTQPEYAVGQCYYETKTAAVWMTIKYASPLLVLQKLDTESSTTDTLTEHQVWRFGVLDILIKAPCDIRNKLK